VPATVDSVVNSREITPTIVMAAAAGGVSVDIRAAANPDEMQIDDRGSLTSIHGSASLPGDLRARAWWWD
jgi:hypothetical protein